MFPTWKHGLISPCSTWSKRWGIHPWSDQMLDTWSCFKNQPWLNNFDSKCRHFSSFFRYGSKELDPKKMGYPPGIESLNVAIVRFSTMARSIEFLDCVRPSCCWAKILTPMESPMLRRRTWNMGKFSGSKCVKIPLVYRGIQKFRTWFSNI